MSVTSILELRVDPERLDEALGVVDATLVATRAFAGCLGVDVLADEHDPAHLFVVERWESLAADTAYREWRATPKGASALGSVLVARPVLTRLVPVAG